MRRKIDEKRIMQTLFHVNICTVSKLENIFILYIVNDIYIYREFIVSLDAFCGYIV